MDIPTARNVFSALLCLLCIESTLGVSVAEDLRLTQKEKAALDKFKVLMMPHLSTRYMKEDIYLVRWLRVRQFNVQQAQRMLLDNTNDEQLIKKNLRWRQQNKMDTITQEDWSDMIEDYPLDGLSHDKEGRPVGVIPAGLWNIRRAAITGRMSRLIRYATSLIEHAVNHVIQDQYRGKNVTQYKIIMNLDGFAASTHACPLCKGIPFYTTFVHNYQNYYPGYTDQIILINSPPAFRTVHEAMLPILTPRAKTVLKVFGTNKSEWLPYLDKEITREERGPELGGTKNDEGGREQLYAQFLGNKTRPRP